jgi:hypothetical protein
MSWKESLLMYIIMTKRKFTSRNCKPKLNLFSARKVHCCTIFLSVKEIVTWEKLADLDDLVVGI